MRKGRSAARKFAAISFTVPRACGITALTLNKLLAPHR